jgi:hypothetical protein
MSSDRRKERARPVAPVGDVNALSSRAPARRPFKVNFVGETGVGKSTLIRQIISRARQSGLVFTNTIPKSPWQKAAADVVLLESHPQGPDAADAAVLVLAPGALPPWEIAAGVRLVVMNNGDTAGATALFIHLSQHLAQRHPRTPLHLTVANQTGNPGVEAVMWAIAGLAGLSHPGGEKPCQLDIPDERSETSDR